MRRTLKIRFSCLSFSGDSSAAVSANDLLHVCGATFRPHPVKPAPRRYCSRVVCGCASRTTFLAPFTKKTRWSLDSCCVAALELGAGSGAISAMFRRFCYLYGCSE